MSFVSLNEVMKDPVVVQLGTTFPSLYGLITYNGQTVDLDGASAVFFMRPLTSRTPVINGEAAVPITPPDANGNNVRYDWQTSDTAIGGEYMGWWGYEFPGGSLAETPEFAIVITDHGPGYGTQTGAVVDGVGQWMPTSLEALRRDSNFGDRFLQAHADYIKRVVLGTVAAPDQEILLDPALIEYLSKRTAVRLITPAIDYWSRQYKSVSAQGPSENASYPDMIASLEALNTRLCAQLPSDWLQLQALVPDLPQLRVETAPKSSLGDPSPFNRPRTPDPNRTRPPALGGPDWQLFLP